MSAAKLCIFLFRSVLPIFESARKSCLTSSVEKAEVLFLYSIFVSRLAEIFLLATSPPECVDAFMISGNYFNQASNIGSHHKTLQSSARMDSQFEVEVCVDTVASAINAEKGGASRIELCCSLTNGGITPSLGTLKVLKKKLSIPIFVLIRPRGGDFCYCEDEIDIMEEDISLFKAHGADGIVVGALTSDGSVDKRNCQRLIEVSSPLPVTFHRAFDLTKDPFQALEDIIALGCKRLLTSGQAKTVAEGLDLLEKLSRKSEGRIILMPGGGISEDNLEAVLRITGVKAFHSSASTAQRSLMSFVNQNISMGAGSTEYCWNICSAERVCNLIEIAKKYFSNPKQHE